MRALVISGGGSKGAFAGGVTQYLLEQKINYDLLLGTSTGSLLIPHIALNNIEKLYQIYTNVDMNKIFSVNPFVTKTNKFGVESVAINHFNVIKQFLKKRKTFGESFRLKQYILDNFSKAEFEEIKSHKQDLVVTVTNLSYNRVEYKSIKDFDYETFCDWIWISCNYVPFMSLVTRNDCSYGDGGLSNLVPIREAINRGATEIDVVILETENIIDPIIIGKNPFSLMVDLFQTLLNQVEKHDITIGKLAAKNKNVKLNLYYTPTKLTDNCLIFNKNLMAKWWTDGYEYAKNKSDLMSEVKF